MGPQPSQSRNSFASSAASSSAPLTPIPQCGESRFRALADHSMDLLALIDANGVFTYASGAHARILGYQPQELVGTSCFNHLHPDDRDKVARSFTEILEAPGQEETSIFRLRRSNGSYGVFEARGRNLLKDPSVGGILVTSRDITAQVDAQSLLQDSEERARRDERRYRAIIDSATDLLAVIDAEGRFTYVSRAYERELGYTPEEMLGLPCTTLVHPDDLPDLQPVMQRAWATPGAEQTVTFRYRRKDGTYRWMEVGGANELDDPAINGVVVSSRDVTAQKEIEEELKHARTAAEAAARAKSEFLANMSHELRTPLNGVLGYVQILHADPSLSSQQEECLDAIETCGQQLLSLINDVLDLSKIEAGHVEVTSDTCHLGQLVRAVGNIVRPRAEAKGVLFLSEIDPSLPKAVWADDRKLRQVLINLLSNAIKFTSQGFVRLTATTDGADRLQFSVIDTGPGIDPSQLLDIFDPFKQTKIGIREEGTGLGLAISRRLAEAMGGRLEVISRVGDGSTFFFDVPLVEAEMPDSVDRLDRRAGPRPRLVLAGSRRPVVMVVDDRRTNRDILIRILRTAGVRTCEARNGKEALDVLAERAQLGTGVELILMDVRMPVMDGLEATRRIQADAALRSTKVIAVTASVFPEARQQIMSAGFDDLIAKPVRIEDLFALLEVHLNVSFVESTDVGGLSGEGAEPLAALPPEVASRTTRRLRDALEIGDFTALGALATELAAQPATAFVGREIGRLARALDFDALSQLADVMAASSSAGTAPEAS